MKQHLGQDGVHFFDRATGLNILLDEITVPIDNLSLAPKYVSIALTNLCNLKCSHCYAPKNTSTLDFERLKGWLKDLDVNGTLGVGFGGGEPFLYENLIELCDYVASETSLALSITTHGHFLTEELACQLKGKINFYRLSMDGINETYEKIRGKSFHQFADKVRIVSRNSKFGINYVVNETTIKDLDQAISFAESVGAFEFLLLPQVKTAHEEGIAQEQLVQLQNWVNRKDCKIRLAISSSFAAGFPTCSFAESKQSQRRFLHIDASGTLKEESFDTQGIIIKNNIIESIKFLKDRQELA